MFNELFILDHFLLVTHSMNGSKRLDQLAALFIVQITLMATRETQ